MYHAMFDLVNRELRPRKINRDAMGSAATSQLGACGTPPPAMDAAEASQEPRSNRRSPARMPGREFRREIRRRHSAHDDAVPVWMPAIMQRSLRPDRSLSDHAPMPPHGSDRLCDDGERDGAVSDVASTRR